MKTGAMGRDRGKSTDSKEEKIGIRYGRIGWDGVTGVNYVNNRDRGYIRNNY